MNIYGNTNYFLHMDIQQKIGDAIASEQPNFKKLTALQNECQEKLINSVKQEDRLFFSEALKMVSEALLAIQANTCDPETNQKIINYVDEKVEVVKQLTHVLTSPDISKHLDELPLCNDAKSLENIPYADHFVVPHQQAAVTNLQNLKDTLLSQNASNLINEVNQLDHKFDKLIQDIISTNKLRLDQNSKGKNIQKEQIISSNQFRAFENEDQFHNVIPSEVVNVKDAFFVEGRISGDGNCGFSSLNTSRGQVVNYLKRQAKNDKRICELAAPEVKGWVLESLTSINENKIPLPIQLKEIKKLFQQLEDITKKMAKKGIAIEEMQNQQRLISDQIEDQLNKFSESSEGLLFYVNQYYEKGGYLVIPDMNGTGVINIIAEKIKQQPVRIWTVNPNDQTQLKLHYTSQVQPTSLQQQAQPLNMIHRGLHFNKIIPINQDIDLAEINQTVPFAGLARYIH